MATTPVTREIAKIMRGKVAEETQNSTWFGHVIGRSQSHASQILRGNKPMSTDELYLACAAFHLSVLDVVRQAEDAAGNPAQAGVPLTGDDLRGNG